MEILIFKTNLINAGHVNTIKPYLNAHKNIHKWNVDLGDCDKVLRIVSTGITANEVEKMLSKIGSTCEELV